MTISRVLNSSLPFLVSLVFLSLSFLTLAPSCSSKSLTGNRALVILQSIADRPQFSYFLNYLNAHGLDVNVVDVNSKPSLFEFGIRTTDHVLILAPSKPLKGDISPKHLLSFMRDGGNLFLTLAANTTESHKDLAYELGIDLVDSTTNLHDFFHSNPNDSSLLASFGYTGESALVPATLNMIPTAFRGIGLIIRSNSIPDIVMPVLSASPTTNSITETVEPIRLVTAVQARNGARAMVVGSIDMLTDKFFDMPVTINKPIMDKYASTYTVSGNGALVDELLKWTLQEKSVVQIAYVTHHKHGELKRPNMYHIKDNIVVNVTLQEWSGEHWMPYVSPPQSDIIFSARMLDDYIRLPMHLIFTTATTSTYSLTTRLPDRYGAFTFTVDHARRGLSPVHHDELVSIRPFRHDEHPRWLPSALPYYVASVSQMVASLILVALWITHKHVPYQGDAIKSPGSVSTPSKPPSRIASAAGKETRREPDNPRTRDAKVRKRK